MKKVKRGKVLKQADLVKVMAVLGPALQRFLKVEPKLVVSGSFYLAPYSTFASGNSTFEFTGDLVAVADGRGKEIWKRECEWSKRKEAKKKAPKRRKKS